MSTGVVDAGYPEAQDALPDPVETAKAVMNTFLPSTKGFCCLFQKRWKVASPFSHPLPTEEL